MNAESVAIVIRDRESEHRYELLVDDVLAVILVYEVRADTMSMNYTKVSDGFARRGLPTHLVAHVLDEARERRLAVLPSCSFVADYIARHPDEYLDLVPETRRREFGL